VRRTVVLVPRYLARTIGLGLPVEQLGIDAILLDETIEVVAAESSALVALEGENPVPTRSRKMTDVFLMTLTGR
jgi:hypothetical protein